MFSRRDEEKLDEKLRHLPRFQLPEEKAEEQIKCISKKLRRRRFSFLRSIQMTAFLAGAIGLIIMIGWNAWKIEQTSDERVSGSPSEQPINDQEAKWLEKIEKDFEGSGPPLDIISRGSVVDGKLEVEHPDPSREYLKTLVGAASHDFLMGQDIGDLDGFLNPSDEVVKKMESPDYENEISGKEWYGLGEANERTDQALEVAKGIDNLDPAFIEYMNQVREYLNTAKADNDYRSFLKAMGMLIRLDDTITEKSNLDLFKENRQKPSGSRPETKIGQFIWELEGMKGKEMDLESLDTHLTVTSDEGKSLFADYEDKDWETLKDGNQLTLSYEIEGETVKVWIEIVDDHGISSKTGAKIIDWEIQ